MRILEWNRIVTLIFDAKPTQLFEIFKYLSLVHNDVLGDYNNNYSRQQCDELSLFWVTSRRNVTVLGNHTRHFGPLVADPSLLPFRATMFAENGDKLSV